jgi:CHAT domain-containing protein/tetratricopeptide (TPR) repeat protein
MVSWDRRGFGPATSSLPANSPGLAWLAKLLYFFIVSGLGWEQAGLVPTIAAQPARPAVESSVAQDQVAERALEVGKPIEGELAGGQSDRYAISLAEGQFVEVVVEQHGVDVVLRLLGPDDKLIAEFDSEIRKEGQEVASQVAETAGGYRLIVQNKEQKGSAGRYEIRVIEVRAATERDRALQEARQLYAEGVKRTDEGKYDQARPLLGGALDIRAKALGPENPLVARSLNSLGLLYRNTGDYAKAELACQRALTISEKALGPEHPDVATSLNGLANVHLAQGDYAAAEPLHQRALSIRVKALGSDHPEVAISLNNLAILYHLKGDYPKAERLYQRTLAIREKLLGPDHPFLASTLNNLAALYQEKGDNARAEPLYQRALAVFEKAFSSEHPETARTLDNLGNLYRSQGDYEKAESFHLRALAIREKTLAPNHPDIAQSLNNLATVYSFQGADQKAEPLHRRALAIREKTLGPEHREVASSLHNLAEIYSAQGEYANAEPLQQRALAIWEKALGSEHPHVALALNDLAVLNAAKGDISQAIAYQSRASIVSERNVTLNTATGSEHQKLAYLVTLSQESERTVSMHVQLAPNDAAARTLAMTTVLLRKGRALDQMTDSIAVLRRRASASDQALFDQLSVKRSQLARLVLGGPQRATSADHQSRVKGLEDQVDKLEAEISGRSDEFRAQSQPIAISPIQSALPAGAALVEFFIYRPLNPKYRNADEQFGAPRYVAYILSPRGEIKSADLGDAAAIHRTVASWRRALRDPNRADVNQLARALDEQVMRPVRKLLGHTRRVFLSPDGGLNLIPFGALVDEQDKYLVERYSLTYLTSGRDLLRLQVHTASKQAPMVVANPQFDLGQVVADPQTREQDGEPRRSADFTRSSFDPLPGTAVEARALGALLPGATVLTGAQATEAAIKEVKGPIVLHVATHGFFLADWDRGGTLPEDPLLRSGLILAGANQQRSGAGEDGILTASEVAALDLWGTKLVVLSACDSGLGDVKNGDGVYGLRRALVLAGSESQVMSLWEVADDATQELMVEYYRALKRGEGRSEGLRNVQLKMLKHSERRHPFYWASFIQSGEWGNLNGKR